jgi:hypothetical protein
MILLLNMLFLIWKIVEYLTMICYVLRKTNILRMLELS